MTQTEDRGPRTEDLPPARPSARYTRELTALVLAPVAVWMIGWSPEYVFDAAVGLIAVLALHEFLTLGKRKGYDVPVVLCIVVTVFIVAAFILESVSVEMGMFVTLLVIPASYVFRSGDIERALPSSAIAVLATLYVGMLAGSLIRLRNDFPVGPKLVFFLVLVVWLGDAGAYYTGKQLGRHKMSPRISPKKTVEGAVGGVITSVTTAVVIHFTFFQEFPLLHAIGVGIVLSIAGMIGDLAESMWKRSAAVKDSGTLIPGHGGFLDRFDSVLFTTPILYVYWAVAQGNTSLNMIHG
ncbi:MAG TPA: phosphatidate cytidylyltransferase [Thermoanaerobaculia bacterium]|nr:phosphatidate cytidylyltransferase [Thermoanaerobaculia bacterium]